MFTLLATAIVLAPPVPIQVSSCSAEIVYATTLGDPLGATAARPFLIVRANGSVGSSGWGDARLVDRGRVTALGVGPSKDGYLEFSLVAKPPSSKNYHLDLEIPVSAAMFGEIVVVPGVLKGVRVYGTNDNAVAAKIVGLEAVEGRASKPKMIEDSRRKTQPGSR